MSRPDMIDDWPVRWESRGRRDDGHSTIDGMTAVVDGSRLKPAQLVVSVGKREIAFEVGVDNLDGQPVDSVPDIAEYMADDLVNFWIEQVSS